MLPIARPRLVATAAALSAVAVIGFFGRLGLVLNEGPAMTATPHKIAVTVSHVAPEFRDARGKPTLNAVWTKNRALLLDNAICGRFAERADAVYKSTVDDAMKVDALTRVFAVAAQNQCMQVTL